MGVRVVRVGPAVRLQMLIGSRNEWLGVGEVRVDSVRLRDGSRPAVLRIDTPEGILYTRYELSGIRETARGATIVLKAFGFPWGRQEYQDEYSQQRFTLASRLDAVEDEVRIRLTPSRLRLAGRLWTGFSYAFAFRSRTRAIHRVLFDATWELGGSIVGNTVLNQGQCSPPVYQGRRSSRFFTSCLKRLDLHDSPLGYSYQLAPRGGMIQAFDFQHGQDGALFQYWKGWGLICSDLHKRSGETRLHVVDEYRFPLARRVMTEAQHVLFTPGPVAEHEGRDLWWEAYEHVADGLCRPFHIRRTEVRPEFDPPRNGRLHEGRLQANVDGEWVDAPEIPYAVADRLLPRAAAAGVRRMMNVFVTENDASVLGFRRKLDSGIDGDLFCGSVCSTHRFFPSAFWGGMEGWRYLYQAGHRLGIEMGHWFAPHMSPRAAIFEQHPEWLTTAVHTLTAGGGYWNILATLDWNTPVYRWILDDLKRWHDEGGLDYLFVDSWPNLGLLPVNYAAGMRPNARALARFFGDLQKIGIGAFSFEGISPFGISRISIADSGRNGEAQGVAGVVGQNDFSWWCGEPDMGYNLNIHLRPRGRSEEEVRQMLFRALANRGGLILPKLHGGGYQPPGWLGDLYRVYDQVLPHMRRRRLLPGQAGVSWEDGPIRVVWSFKPVLVEAGGLREAMLVTGQGLEPAGAGEKKVIGPLQVVRYVVK